MKGYRRVCATREVVEEKQLELHAMYACVHALLYAVLQSRKILTRDADVRLSRFVSRGDGRRLALTGWDLHLSFRPHTVSTLSSCLATLAASK